MKKLLLLLSALLFLSACSTKPSEEKIYRGFSTESGFDTEIQLLATVESQEEFDKYFDLTKKEFWKYNQLFDKYNNYKDINNIKTINDMAGIEAVEVDPLIIEMLLLSEEYTEISNGYFDITFGPVLEIWHDYREEGLLLNAQDKPGHLPPMEKLEEAKLYSGWEFLEIDTEKNTVYLTHKNSSLDVGAVAKGFATELVALTLEEEGLKHALVSGGGNIRSIGSKASGEPWNIGVQKPADIVNNDNIEVFSFTENISMVTSGDYQRYYYSEDNERISHLINPKTLMPQTDFRSVTIITPSSTEADALSTAVYMMSYEEALEFVESYNSKYPGRAFEILWIDDAADRPDWEQVEDFSLKYTDGLKELLKSK